nr:methyl-accepting chemotaxis protein [Lachnospiraceae bacterium]
MNEVEEITNEQNEKITDTREKFDIVSGGITETRDKTEEIKNAIDECNRVQIKVDQLISNLSAISEEYAASTTEAAQSMSELNDTIQRLLGESNKLIDISNTLEESMRSFTL